MSKQLNLNNKNIIFDGFPRNITQYKILKQHFSNYNIVGIWLNFSKYRARRRLLKRKNCDYCNFNTVLKIAYCPLCKKKLSKRNDDYNNIINKRFRIFNLYTKLTIKKFSKEQRIIKINNQKKFQNIIFSLKKQNVK